MYVCLCVQGVHTQGQLSHSFPWSSPKNAALSGLAYLGSDMGEEKLPAVCIQGSSCGLERAVSFAVVSALVCIDQMSQREGRWRWKYT